MIHVDRDCWIILVLVVIGSFLSGVYEGIRNSKPVRSSYCKETVAPYWNTLLECTSETCHRPLPCVVHGAHKGGAS